MIRNRSRNPDKYKKGRSSLVPYIESESWKERYQRRMKHALQNKQKVENWCGKNKWKMFINNEGHHWVFFTNERKIIEWWPSSGKLIIGKQWKQGVHCHDYIQLLEVFTIAQKTSVRR